MTLRKSLLALCFSLFAFNAFSFVSAVEPTPVSITPEQAQKVEAMLNNLGNQDLSTFTIRQAEELAGRKLTLKEKIGFKVAKMKMKKIQRKAETAMKSGNGLAAPGIDKGVYIILAIFIPFLAVGLATDWKGNDWLWALLLSFLCGLPGIIYALVKMKNYYP